VKGKGGWLIVADGPADCLDCLAHSFDALVAISASPMAGVGSVLDKLNAFGKKLVEFVHGNGKCLAKAEVQAAHHRGGQGGDLGEWISPLPGGNWECTISRDAQKMGQPMGWKGASSR
jgi:hypothetical protein